MVRVQAKDKHKKKMEGAHGEVLRLWEKLRRVHLGLDAKTGRSVAVPVKDDKEYFIDRILELIGDSDAMSDAIVRQDLSRVMQSCAKFGSAAQRTRVFEGLAVNPLRAATNTFSAPCFCSLLRHSDGVLAKRAMVLLIPFASKLLCHKVGVRVLDTAWKRASSRVAQTAILVCALGRKMRALVSDVTSAEGARGPSGASLSALAANLAPSRSPTEVAATILSAHPEDIIALYSVPPLALLRDHVPNRIAIAKSLESVIERAVVKGTVSVEVVLRVLHVYLCVAHLGSIRETLEDVAPRLVHAMDSKVGAMVATNAIALASPVDRLAIVKSLKHSLASILQHPDTLALLCRMVDLLPVKSASIGAVFSARGPSGELVRTADLPTDRYPHVRPFRVDSSGGVVGFESRKRRKRDDPSAADAESGAVGAAEYFLDDLLKREVLANIDTARVSLLESATGSRFVLHLLTSLPYRKGRYFDAAIVDSLLWNASRDDGAPPPDSSSDSKPTSWRVVGDVLSVVDGKSVVSDVDVSPDTPPPWVTHFMLLDAILPVLRACLLAPATDGAPPLASNPNAKRVFSELLWQSKSDPVVHPVLLDERFKRALSAAMDTQLARGPLEDEPRAVRFRAKGRERRRERKQQKQAAAEPPAAVPRKPRKTGESKGSNAKGERKRKGR